MIGIMAAVAIPAYQDYVERSRSRGAQLAPTIQQPPAAVMAKAAWPGAGRVWFAEQA
jgi:Tfp pilus assembly major pilin PilA